MYMLITVYPLLSPPPPPKKPTVTYMCITVHHLRSPTASLAYVPLTYVSPPEGGGVFKKIPY